MLTSIIAVTLTVPDLEAVERAYGKYLDYRVVDRGNLTPDLAGLWAAPALAGREYRLMQPASGAPVYLRLVVGDRQGEAAAVAVPALIFQALGHLTQATTIERRQAT